MHLRLLPRALCSVSDTQQNDRILMSHYHPPSDGFPNLGESNGDTESDADSTSSVVRKSPMIEFPPKDETGDPRFSDEVPLTTLHSNLKNQSTDCKQEIDGLVAQRQEVTISIDVKRYIQDVVVFLRMHRAMGGGMTTQSTRHMDLLVK